MQRHTGVATVSGLSHPNRVFLLLVVLSFDPETDGESLAHSWIGKPVLFRHLRSHKEKERKGKERDKGMGQVCVCVCLCLCLCVCVCVSYWPLRDPHHANHCKKMSTFWKKKQRLSHTHFPFVVQRWAKILHAHTKGLQDGTIGNLAWNLCFSWPLGLFFSRRQDP